MPYVEGQEVKKLDTARSVRSIPCTVCRLETRRSGEGSAVESRALVRKETCVRGSEMARTVFVCDDGIWTDSTTAQLIASIASIGVNVRGNPCENALSVWEMLRVQGYQHSIEISSKAGTMKDKKQSKSSCWSRNKGRA